MQEMDSLKFVDLKEVLDRITSRLVESSDPGALFDAVVQIAMDTTDAQASSLYLEQSEENQLGITPTIMMVAGAGYEVHRIGKAIYRKGEGLTGSIWEESRSVKFDTTAEVENRSGSWRGLHNDFIRQKVQNWICSSLIGVPLRIGTRTIGVIKVENKNPGPPAHFSDRDYLVLKLIASTIALAIENRRLYEKAYNNILSVLREVSDMLVSKDIIPFQALCDRIVGKCIDIFKAQACSLYLETPHSDASGSASTITMVAGAGYEVHRIGKAIYRKGEGLTGSIWEESRSVKFDTTAEVENRSGSWRGLHNDLIRQKVQNWICSSLIGVPLRIGNRAIGVIKVENKNPAPHAHFSHEELRSLEILASNIALALEMLNRHREIFRQGERARSFAHNLANQVKNALHNVTQSNAELRQAPNADQINIIQERLVVVEKNLTEFEQLRKQTLGETSADRHRVSIDVRILLQDLKRRSDKILAEKKIALQSYIPSESLFVNVDRDQILQALGNILSNAIEAIAEHSAPEISIKVEHRPDSKEVVIAIHDNGSGLNLGQRDKFRQSGQISSTKHSGIGAGLPEASRCCADNGGRLEIVDSSIASGGAFKIILPTCNPGILRIAVVDDGQEFIDSIKIELMKRESIISDYYTTRDVLLPPTVENSELVNRFFEYTDFILLDCAWNMGLDGVQIYKELSNTKNPLAKKIILVTGHEEYLRPQGQEIQVFNKYEDILHRFDEFVAFLYSRKN